MFNKTFFVLVSAQALIVVATGTPSKSVSRKRPGIRTEEAASSTTKLNINLPRWALKRSADYLLDFTKADADILAQQDTPLTFRGHVLNATRKQGYYYGNLAIVRFGSELYVAVRKLQFFMTLRSQVPEYPKEEDPSKKWLSWWVSKVSLCRADPETLQPGSCTDFDPRSWKDKECMWNAGFESLGPEDPRFIVWPGKGLYIMFISKPWAERPSGIKPSDTQCAGPWAQQPWLMPLVTFQWDAAAASDPWSGSELIRLQYMSERAAELYAAATQGVDADGNKLAEKKQVKHHGLHKEKNWNPFIYENELYFSQSLEPHVVIKPSANGTCTKLYETKSMALKVLPAKPKGNTQAVLLPSSVTGELHTVYMGILHTEVNRSYTNYFYKMQLLEETQQLMIGYGSGDQAPRVKLMGLEEALQLFTHAALKARTPEAAAAERNHGTSKVEDGKDDGAGG